MKHPIDVSFQSIVRNTGESIDAFVIKLVQENPSYAEGCASSEHILAFEHPADLERFLNSQALEPVYDQEAQDALGDLDAEEDLDDGA